MRSRAGRRGAVEVDGGRVAAGEHDDDPISEDPATGSSTGPLASFMMRSGLLPAAAGTRFHSEQGTKMGRRSILQVVVHGENGVDGIDVGGYVTPVATGLLTL